MKGLHENTFNHIHNDAILNGDELELMASRAMLKKMATVWDRRAQVKKHFDITNEVIDPDKPDFLVELLPFADHPDFLSADEHMKQKILSCGWLAYNEKTIAIESAIISPACNDILNGFIPGTKDQVCRQLVGETLVDEAYHILMVVNACKITREQRNIDVRNLPMFTLEKQMRIEQSKHAEAWKKRIVCLTTAIVSEIFISAYLDQLSEEEGIQPLNRLTVEAHRKDELAHGNIFTHLTKCIYANLNEEERKFFIETIPKPVLWFSDGELDIWHSMLDQIGFANTRTVIEDTRPLNTERVKKADFSGIISLAGEIGILEDKAARDTFIRYGLLQ